MTRTRALSCCIALLLIPFLACGQFDDLGIHSTWHSGTIVLEDHSRLTGLIQYNDKLSLIKYKQQSDAEEESFTERPVLEMSFFDERLNKQRQFATMTLKIDDGGSEIQTLFEIVLQAKAFALVSRSNPVQFAIRDRGTFSTIPGQGTLYQPRQTAVGYKQFRMLGLVHPDGTIKTILWESEFARKKSSPFSEKRPDRVNEKYIKQFMDSKWPEVESFMKDHKLNMKKADDLIQMFEYYRTLAEE